MIKIVADTTSGIPLHQAAKLGVAYIPQIIVFGNKSYRDDTELDTTHFLKMLGESPILPKTAAPSPSLYTPIFSEYGKQGNTIFVICPSQKLSGTFRSATVAAQDFPNADIRIIDTLTIAGGLATLVLKAVEWADSEMSPDQLENKIIALAAQNKTYFMVDTLEFLQKGGRIGGAAALLGGILKIKPILATVDGEVQSVESQRTHRRAITRLKELVVTQYSPGENMYLSVMHGDAQDEAEALAADLSEAMNIQDIPIYELPPAILVHAGPGVLAVSYFSKSTNKISA